MALPSSSPGRSSPRVKRLFAVPAAVLVTLVVIVFGTDGTAGAPVALWTPPAFVTPVFSLSAAIGIALPLFIVTMASQNIPGFAVLKVNGYNPPAGPLFKITGLFSILGAPLRRACGEPVGDHGGPVRRARRAPRSRTALLGGGRMRSRLHGLRARCRGCDRLHRSLAARADPGGRGSCPAGGRWAGRCLARCRIRPTREAALVTFLVTASGLTFYGINGAFWGLVAGGTIRALTRWRKPELAQLAAHEAHADEAARRGLHLGIGRRDRKQAAASGLLRSGERLRDAHAAIRYSTLSVQLFGLS